MMPTVMLTCHCPNACPWCFARPKMEEYQARGIREISWDDFLTVVDFYERSGLRQMVLLGGEPGLHSRFMDILHLLSGKKFSVLVGTTGILPESLVDAIAEAGFQDLNFFLNSTSYFKYGKDQRKQVDHFLFRLGRRVALSYTITERDLAATGVEPVLDRIAMMIKFNLSRHLQFQIAVPGERNRLFVPFDRYGDLAELVRRWFAVLRKNHIHCRLDCHCMPSCAISEDLREAGIFTAKCDHFMIDIGPDLEVWPCFPLSQQSFNLDQFSTMGDIYRHCNRMNAAERILYDEQCQDCGEREAGNCHGGCRGFQHLRGNPDMTHHSVTPLFQQCTRRTVPCG
jgi:MoaA/NifB/PqqE/SkfB family radical SAM enzyme